MDERRLGLGVMIQMLGGNEEAAKAVETSIGKTISSLELDKDGGDGDGAVIIGFTDNSVLTLFDGGRSCCESRYIVSDADLQYFVGAKLINVKLAELPLLSKEEDYDVHEAQSLQLETDKGVVDFVTHNEHNGYYGGFWIKAELKGGT